MHRYTSVAVAWGLLLSSLCCCSTATALECPSDVVSLESIATPTSITLQAGKSYELGPGVYVLNETVEVPAESLLCVAGQDRVGVPAGVTRLLSPEGAGQLHFAQYGGLLKINNLQLQGRADSDGGGGVVIKRSKDGTDDKQPATFIARLVTFKSISPRAVANDDAAANLTFTNCAFLDNVYNTWGCENQREWFCSFTGPPGAAGVTTASNATFSGSTVFRRNSWGALYVASPVTVTFEGKLVVADNTKRLWGQGFEYDEDNFTTEYGAGLIASGGARLLFFGAVQIRNNTGFGGCGMYLSRASATFASAARTVQFTRNRGSYGAAMKAYESNVQFNGPVLMADNTAIEGAGGAFHLLLSNVTFNARATVRNNSLHGCTTDFDNGCGGGAMFVLGSQVTHADRATYLRNTASSTDGGALYITGYKYGTNPMNSSFLAANLVTFNGNSATRADKYASTSGGAIWTTNDVTFAGGANFIGNSASLEGDFGSGGAVYATATSALTFGGPVNFKNNRASVGGAVTLAGSMSFANSRSRSCWLGNYASVATGGAALHIEAYGKALFGMQAPHNFGPNTAGPPTNRTEQDIKVLADGLYKCAAGHGAGNYNIEGNVCAEACSLRHPCKCPIGQVFTIKRCSCQSKV